VVKEGPCARHNQESLLIVCQRVIWGCAELRQEPSRHLLCSLIVLEATHLSLVQQAYPFCVILCFLHNPITVGIFLGTCSTHQDAVVCFTTFHSMDSYDKGYVSSVEVVKVGHNFFTFKFHCLTLVGIGNLGRNIIITGSGFPSMWNYTPPPSRIAINSVLMLLGTRYKFRWPLNGTVCLHLVYVLC
jgi:hypothetical protein